MFPFKTDFVPVRVVKSPSLFAAGEVISPYLPVYRTPHANLFFLDWPWKRRALNYITRPLYFWLARLLWRSKSYCIRFENGKDPWNPLNWSLVKRVLVLERSL